MAYQLKTTGIAANCTMCMAVDPDTGTLKDFASSAVTADMTVPGGVTFGTTTWDGNTRNYFKAASGAVPAFGANKPAIRLNATTNTALSLVAILRAPSADIPRYAILGTSSSQHFAPYLLSSGGATHPSVYGLSAERHGTSAIPTAGTRQIFGFSLNRTSAEYNWYTATDVAASMTTGTVASPGDISMDLSVVCGLTGVTTSVNVSDFFAILAFNVALTEAQWDSLRDDWRGVLLESAGSTDATGTGAPASITLTAPTGSATGTGGATNGTGTGTLQSIILTAPAGTATGTSAGAGTITTPVMKNNTGTVLSNETGVIVNVYNASTGALIVQKTGQTSNASGIVTISDALIVPATTYAYEVVLTGSRRRLPTASAA